MGLAFTLELATSRLATWLRSPRPQRAGALRSPPRLTLVLYEFEACPFCRRVREAIGEIGLEVEIRPCPKGGTRFRPESVARGGKAQFPYLVDANTGRALYESADIAAYLWREYGSGGTPRSETALAAAAGSLASALRGVRGLRARASRAPVAALLLSASERSAEARLVRELLCELEIPYWLSPAAGPHALPVLTDPNTTVVQTGARAIRAYLSASYARA